ncbi:MAG: hypothetical protein JRS35_23155 [Deltaproteobacteria bacterium]|nr:hypothetical protein [Deltaproteobacteria bacterium]
MVVSVAMLGFGTAGSLLTARRKRSGAFPASARVYACGFLALTGLATRDTRTEDAAT